MPPEAEPQDDDTLTIITPDEAAELDNEPADDGDPSSSEAKAVARLMGWKDSTEWKGDKTKFVTAQQFLADVPEVLKHTRQANAKLKSQQDRIIGEVAKLTANQRRQMDAQHELALEAAVEANDMTAVKRITAEIKAAAAPTAESAPVAAFKTRNSEWFDVDPEATAYAAALDAQYARLSNGISDPEAHMQRIEDGVKKKFPELFGEKEVKAKDEPRPRAPLVAGGGRIARTSTGAITVADLTPQQRAAAKELGVPPEKYAASVNDMKSKGHVW